MIYYAALAISIVLNATSLILLKSYALSSGGSTWSRLLDWRLLVSLVAYGLAAVFWLAALVGVDLMVAYPSLALTYVVIGIAANRLFAEEFSPNRWWGILLIVAGVVTMNL